MIFETFLQDLRIGNTGITDSGLKDLAKLKNLKMVGLVGTPMTEEGLKAVFKNFNEAGEGLVKRLQAFRAADVHVLGSFIFGLSTDTPATFDATADRSDFVLYSAEDLNEEAGGLCGSSVAEQT